jgi:hypothetical protein
VDANAELFPPQQRELPLQWEQQLLS